MSVSNDRWEGMGKGGVVKVELAYPPYYHDE